MTPRERGFAYCAIRAYTGLLYVGIVPLFSDFRDKVRNMDLQAGLYRHYKGQNYRVLGVARHSETEEALVIYQALYGEFGLWCVRWRCSPRPWRSMASGCRASSW